MYSLFNALHEGRLIELPDNQKDHALQLLAHMIEAIPDLPAGTDVVGGVLAREHGGNTGLGKGWACPHARIPGEGEMMCAIGWSPVGIAYTAPDDMPVRIVVMHYIPESQKNAYLREISGLAKAIKNHPALGELSNAKDLGEVRHRLIDLLTAAVESAIPDAKARMIQLEAKQAVSALAESLPVDALAALDLVPLSVVTMPGAKPLVLAQDAALIAQMEGAPDVVALLAARAPFDKAGYRIITRSVSAYLPDRMLYDCIAVRLGNQKKPAG